MTYCPGVPRRKTASTCVHVSLGKCACGCVRASVYARARMRARQHAGRGGGAAAAAAPAAAYRGHSQHGILLRQLLIRLRHGTAVPEALNVQCLLGPQFRLRSKEFVGAQKSLFMASERIRPSSANDAFDPNLWATFVSTTLGLEVPILSSLPRHHNNPLTKCGCKKHCMDFHGDHTSTCTAHSGATKAHDWMVGVLGPLFRTAGHTVRTQHGVTASAGQRRGDVELRSYLQDAAGRRSLVFDLSMTHDRFGSSSHVQQNGLLSHPQDLDAPLRVAAQRKING
jgi:hypothetical protein